VRDNDVMTIPFLVMMVDNPDVISVTDLIIASEICPIDVRLNNQPFVGPQRNPLGHLLHVTVPEAGYQNPAGCHVGRDRRRNRFRAKIQRNQDASAADPPLVKQKFILRADGPVAADQ
jgi:hypothetical protein